MVWLDGRGEWGGEGSPWEGSGSIVATSTNTAKKWFSFARLGGCFVAKPFCMAVPVVFVLFPLDIG